MRIRHRFRTARSSPASSTVLVSLILWMALHSTKIISPLRQLFIGLSLTTRRLLMWVRSTCSRLRSRFCCGARRRFRHPVSVRYRSERFKNDNLILALEEGVPAAPRAVVAGRWPPRRIPCSCRRHKGISEPRDRRRGHADRIHLSITVLPAMLKLLKPARRKGAGRLRVSRPARSLLEKHRIPSSSHALVAVRDALPIS